MSVVIVPMVCHGLQLAMRVKVGLCLLVTFAAAIWAGSLYIWFEPAAVDKLIEKLINP